MISKTAVKYIKSLQDKKQRQKYDQFVVEGEKSIKELLKSQYEVVKLYANEVWIAKNELFIKDLNVQMISDSELKQISFHQTPQQVLAIVKQIVPQIDFKINELILALDEIQDPGNLGTIIRIADWYGINKIICSKGCTDIYNPKCINSTMGSFTRVSVLYADILDVVNSHHLNLIVSTFDGENIHHFDAIKSGVIVIGNEGHGISKTIIESASYKITIPKIGEAESLNAAVSTAIILDNFFRKF